MDNSDDKRDEQLIKEREEYEKAFFSQIIDGMIESKALDTLISNRLEYIDENFDFEPSPAYERLEKLYYAEYDTQFQEQISDVDDYIDYPDGPDENLSGIKREIPHETFYDESYIESELEDQEELELQRMVEEHEEYLNSQSFEEDYKIHLKMNDFNPAEAYEELIQEAIIEEDEEYEEYMNGLIEQHVAEEKDIIDDIMSEAAYEAIMDEAYFERAIDRLIFDRIEIDYEPDMFDYDDREEFWYGPHYDRPDESVIDPFDSFGEIDYPEGEPKHEFPVEIDYDEEIQRDFEKYQRRKERQFGYADDELPEPEDELILEPPQEDEIEFDDVDEKRNQILIENREKIESKFKDYFKEDDTLDRIINEKLKEKKFNQ